MRLLPKSIHRCRRYPTKFNSGRDIPLREQLWVLHAFQKKAKHGIKTPKKDIDLIRERLKRLKKELRK